MTDALEKDDVATGHANGEPAAICATCIYMRRLPPDPQNIGKKMQGGICKRMPPTPIILVSQGVGGQIVQQMQSFSPPVADGDSCGEWYDGSEDDGD